MFLKRSRSHIGRQVSSPLGESCPSLLILRRSWATLPSTRVFRFTTLPTAPISTAGELSAPRPCPPPRSQRPGSCTTLCRCHTAAAPPALPLTDAAPDISTRECHSTADIVAMDVNGRFQIQLADGELISVKPCKLKPLPLPKQQAARAINWAEYSQLESRVRSLECADSTHSAAATLTLGAKKEHRTAPVPGTPRVRAPQPRPRRTSRPARRAGALHPSSQRRVPRSLPLSPPAPLSRFWGTTLWQPQTWASGGVEGSIERSKKILKECDTNEPFLRARARAAQERMATATGEERRAAHAVSSKASFSALMVTMKKQAIDSNPSQRLRELLAQEALGSPSAMAL